jgi:primosomal protein N' (replication factor Y)
MMLPKYLKKPKKLSIDASPETKNSAIPKKTFIKANDFNERYSYWRETVKEKLKTGSVLVIFPQLSFLIEAHKIIEKDFDDIKTLHSYESEKELFQNWVSSRKKSLILGTRVSLFYYPKDLALLVIEEENSQYYFQEEKPFYHLFDLTILLTEIKNIDVVFSANFPSLYAYNLIKNKKIELIDKGGEKGEVKVVSVGEHRRQLISPLLVEFLKKHITQGERVVILWNKTGFGSYLACSSCGDVFRCPNCSGFMRLSLIKNKGVCPHCGNERDIPKTCNLCNNGYIRSSGMGIERIELILRRIFPDVRIAEWESRKPDTQIVLATSKIIGAIYAQEKFDSGFLLDADYQMSRLDYDATFDTYLYIKTLLRMFQKNVYIFTRNKNHYLFELINTEWTQMYEKELSLRQELMLPPFGTVAKITLRSYKEDGLIKHLNEMLGRLKDGKLDVYGPLKEHPYKLRGKFRYSIIVKSKEDKALRKSIKEIVSGFRTSSLQAAVVIR